MDEVGTFLDVSEFAAEYGLTNEQVTGLMAWGQIVSRDNIQISRTELQELRRVVAYHEAGHVVVAKLLGWTVHDVTIAVDSFLGTGGFPRLSPPVMDDPLSPDYDSNDMLLVRIRNVLCFEKQSVISAAGREGQILGTGRVPNNEALAADVHMIETFSVHHPELKHTNGLDVLQQRAGEARAMLQSRRSALDAIASELVDKTTLRNEIDALLHAHGV